ncbi:MAG: hypothetical protein P1Q69_17910, partial [Candidatus Thorarchaeota archaeon]|nr:hypothetical protein [Candidatus Thorarchaeota archaeon]
DLSPAAFEIWLDDTREGTYAYSDGEYIDYMVYSESAVTLNVTVFAWDDDNNNVTKTCIVTYVDSTGPSITGQDDFIYELGDSPLISWSWTELNPKNYTIYENDSLAVFSTSFSGDIEHTLDGLTVGKWNITLIIYDDSGHFETDELWVTVEDTTDPTSPDFPADFQVETGSISWVNFTLNDLNPNIWEVWRDDTMDATDAFADGEYIQYMLNYVTPGAHNITLVAWDDSDNILKLTCFVTYSDSTAPTIIGPIDSGFEAGESPLVSWSWTELNPENYTIYENGTQAIFSASFSGNIEHILDGLIPGKWNITLIFYDTSGNFEADEVWVTVEDTTAPTLVGFASLNVELGEVLQINWQVSNIGAWDQDGTWQVYVNGTAGTPGVWDSTQVSYAFAPDLGKFNVTMVVTDAYGNSVTNTTWVTCQDTIAPELSGLADQEISESESILLNWTCSDLDPESLVLTRNGSVIIEQIWVGSDYSYPAEDLALGVYNYTLVVTDGSGNSASDSVLLTVTAEATSTTTTTTTTSTTTPTDTSTTDTTTPPPDDGGVMMLLLVGSGIGAIVIVVVILFLRKKK